MVTISRLATTLECISTRTSGPNIGRVRIDAQQLAAFAAVIELGSFDAAAQHLHVTPSAISQRIKSLEQRVGRVLVIREKPCMATAAGVPLLRLAAQTALLETEALTELGGAGSADRVRIALAVNADSMSTWFTAVLGRLPDVLFDIRIEDQDHSARLLREGVVMGAVTTERTPVPGCRVESLGVMRYVPVASPAYMQRYLPDGVPSVFSFDLAGPADEGAQERVGRVIDALRVVRLVANIGDARSLVAHPASMTHSHLNAEQREAAGISLTTIRLSAGLEDPRDLIADLDQALAKA